ncbi:hypothetical protein [Thermocatellispora tengchongensis]|uniref:hypothetical protein n=1 Tax=Thermocatellispora tengchongensis TaxID=1073253 RepID=UPI00362F9859
MRGSFGGRLAVFAAAALALVVVVAVVVVRAREERSTATAAVPTGTAIATGPAEIHAEDLLAVRTGPGAGSGTVLASAGGALRALGVPCRRFYAAAGTAVCLRVTDGVITGSDAIVLDGDLRERERVELPGVPSRARVSASGRMISWTVFVTGDSYLSVGFSTRTGILDTRTGKVTDSLEKFELIQNGEVNRSVDLNYWGVTFTADDNVFYATVSTRGRVYLVKGDVAARRMTVVKEGRSARRCPPTAPGWRTRSAPATPRAPGGCT